MAVPRRLGGRFFVSTIGCEALWAVAYGATQFVFDPALGDAFEVPIWLAINFIGVFFLAFALEYTGWSELLRSKVMGGVVGLQLLHTLVVASNPLHGIAWTGYRIDPTFGAATVSDAHAFFSRDIFDMVPAARRIADRAAIDNLGSAVVVVDAGGRIIERNDEAARVLRLPTGAALGGRLAERAASVRLRPLLDEVRGEYLAGADADVPVVTARAADAGDGRITIEVEDDGPGVPAHELDVLDATEETALEHGSGLGLWIVKWGVASLGGTVEFDVSDAGTTARVTLPAASVDDAGEDVADTPTDGGSGDGAATATPEADAPAAGRDNP